MQTGEVVQTSDAAPGRAEDGLPASAKPHLPRRGVGVPRRLQGPLTFVVVLLLWEVGVTLLRVPQYVLPAPSAVVDTLIARRAVLLQSTLITGQEILAGYLLAVVISIPMAVAIAYSRFFERTLYPILVFSQNIPKIALAPLFVIWLGFGFSSKLLLTFLLCFFPIVVDGIVGFKSIDPDVMDLARSTGANGWRLFTKIRLPGALPNIFAGLKVSSALAPVGAIVAEFVASDRGLGYLLLQANGDLNTRLAFADIVILSTIGVLLYFVVEALERVVIPWHVSQRVPEEAEAPE